MTDTVFLHQIHLMCHIGVTDSERSEPQEVVLDVDLDVDLAPSATTDDVALTIDYRDMWETVRDRVTEHEFKLVETLVERVADDLLARFPGATRVAVQAVKPRAMAERNVGSTGVRITRQRE